MDALLETNTPQLQPPQKKRKIFQRLLLASLLCLIAASAVLIFSITNISKLKKQLSDAKSDFGAKLAEQSEALDAKIERLEKLTLKLKEQGYVEADQFDDMAARVLAATVLVTSTKESITLSPTGEITTTKEFDPEGSSGSGFFVRADGLIATAKHVVDAIGSENLIVILPSGKKSNAELVATNETADAALIKIDGQNYPALELGHFENLAIGEEVGFAGYALSTGITRALIHRGVVSTKGADLKGAPLFAINAFINRGNSGGPVFSAKTGRVVGVIAARQKAKTSEKIVKLPPGYSPAVSFGGTDPVRLSVELYNKTLEIVGDVSQVGIGIAYSTDNLTSLLPK
ncbi:MAG: serine protease [bacterium]|nr:serine protease [bacterium]